MDIFSIKNRSYFAQSLFFAAYLLVTNLTFTSEKTTPLTSENRINLTDDSFVKYPSKYPSIKRITTQPFAKSLFFDAYLLVTKLIFTSEKTTPLTSEERINLTDDIFANDTFIKYPSKYPSIKRIETQPDDKQYGTCLNYAISKTLGLKGQIPEVFSIEGQNDWYDALEFTTKYCKEIYAFQAQKGDLVTFHDNPSLSQKILHAAIVYDDGIIEDKWGAYPHVFIHPTFDVPACYGNNVKYHRIIKSTDEIIKDIKTTISKCDYEAKRTKWNNKLVQHAELADNNLRKRIHNAEMENIYQRIMCLDVEASNDQGQSLLMIGAKNNNFPLVTRVLLHKAKLNKKDKNGKTAIDLAKENGHSLMVKLLEDQQKSPLYRRLERRINKTTAKSFWEMTRS